MVGQKITFHSRGRSHKKDDSSDVQMVRPKLDLNTFKSWIGENEEEEVEEDIEANNGEHRGNNAL